MQTSLRSTARLRPRVGAILSPVDDWPRPDSTARRLEVWGFDEVWIVEERADSAALSAAGAMLAATSCLVIGIDLRVPFEYGESHVMSQLRDLVHRYPHRVQLSVELDTCGRPTQGWAPRGDDGVVLTWLAGFASSLHDQAEGTSPIGYPQVFVGVSDLAWLSLVGKLANGVRLAEGASARMVRSAVSALPHDSSTLVYSRLYVDDDPDGASEFAALSDGRDGHRGPRGALGTVGSSTSAAVVESAIVGDPTHCAGQVTRLHRAGATSIALRPLGPAPHSQLERFSEDVLPLVLANALTS